MIEAAFMQPANDTRLRYEIANLKTRPSELIREVTGHRPPKSPADCRSTTVMKGSEYLFDIVCAQSKNNEAIYISHDWLLAHLPARRQS